jgi:DNA recombination-dependent growth factor C
MSCFFVEGALPDSDAAEFIQALQRKRFKSIENAASEEVSVGWVSPADPTGETFEGDDIRWDHGLWLQMRIDRKKVPARWLQIHRLSAEHKAGRKLSAKERRELKESLTSTLLARTLPAVQLVDVLLHSRKNMFVLFANANAVKEAFLTLVHKTFAVPLAASDPRRLALSLDLGRERKSYLPQVSPVRWHAEPGKDLPGGQGELAQQVEIEV